MDQTRKFATADEVFYWMEQTCAHVIQPGLERMEWVLDRLTHPERRCKFIHIAGTNGKGSTAAMITSVLREAGYPTGLFISPYVTEWNERIQLNGEPISEEDFVYWANHLRPLVEEMINSDVGAPSPFEFWTLLAICYFAYEACPWFIVWETGLGGRLDSTNVVYPLVSVITQIGYDHKDWLGNTIAEIAREKAGIIKEGVPVVLGSEDEEAITVIKDIAKQKKCQLYLLNKDFYVKQIHSTSTYQTFVFSNVYRTLPELKISLVGEHQLHNAATALMAIEVLRQNYATIIDREHFETGMKKAFWPGRLETVGEHPLILLDGAHNADGIQALVETIKKIYTYNRIILMIAMMKDKEIVDSIQPLLSLVDVVFTTQVKDQPRSLSAEELAHLVRTVRADLSVQPVRSAEEALTLMKQQAKFDDLLLITGSLYLVSEVRPYLVK